MHLTYIWIVSHLSAKNYQNWWKFDEVLTKTNLLSFFGTQCTVNNLQVSICSWHCGVIEPTAVSYINGGLVYLINCPHHRMAWTKGNSGLYYHRILQLTVKWSFVICISLCTTVLLLQRVFAVNTCI